MKNYIGFFGAAFFGGMLSISAVDYYQREIATNHRFNNQHSVDEMVKPALFTENEHVSTYVDLSGAAEEVVQEVVHVKVTQEGQEMIKYDPMEFFYNGKAQGKKFKAPDKQGSGSGVVIREDGYIITNNHVIQGADKIEIVFNTNESFIATVVGADPSTDLALLKIEATELKEITIGNSDEVKLGEWVLAVGNPYNLNSTVTAGIISAKARNINILQNRSGNPPLEAFIQTDAAVNPGNSGGALVNTQGELIGINSAIKSPTGSYSGYSFAIPVNIMKKVVNDIMEYGVVQRAFIGVSIRDINAELAKEADLKTMSGAYISGLSAEGAASKAGIKTGDVVTSVNNVKVKSVAELQSQIGKFNPGDEVMVDVNRDGENKQFTLELRNNEGTTDVLKAKESYLTDLGADFENVSNKLKNGLDINYGISVQNIRSGKFLKSGMKEGFIITHIDNAPVKDLAEFKKILRSKKGGVLFSGLYPNGYKKYYGVGM
jgi:Do/DeqQ family serine protease